MTGESVVSGCRTGEEVGARVAARLKSGRPVDGVLARNDRLAGLVLQACREKGFSVPDDISLIAFDNSTLSRATHPPLTVMEIDRKGVAAALVEVFLAALEGRTAPAPELRTVLVERGTTRPIRPPRVA
jgi:DNA-binding LacI/PurR family transcriptional regulator